MRQPRFTPPGQRDLVMDLVRVFCLALVVVGHLLMLGASVGGDGGLVVERTLLLQPWFTPVTWGAQVMPVFFVVGGLLGVQAWRRTEARGGSAAEFIRGRVRRLARPAVPFFVFLSVAVLAMQLAGLDHDTVATIATGAASALWFLAAYTFSQAYLPGMATLHGRAPVRTLVGLAVAAVAVDLLRYTSGLTVLGLFNMIFVWLFIQQLGFWAADGWFEAKSRRSLLLLTVGSYVTLGVVTTVGPYPANMLDNLNPPTAALDVLAVAQFSLVMLLHPLLSRLMRHSSIRVLVAAIGSRLMTVYLWHLPVLALIVGLQLLTPLPTPEPGSAAWWLTRPLILAIAVLALCGIAAALGRFERPVQAGSVAGARVSDWSIGASTALMIIPPFTVMVFGLNLVIAVTGTILLAVAVRMQTPLASPARARAAHSQLPTAGPEVISPP